MTVLLAAAALTLGTPPALPFQDRPDHKRITVVSHCRTARGCIHRAAARWHISEAVLVRKAWCESRMNPGAYNPGSGASGLFQFLPSTWATTPYAHQSIWNPRWSALAAAWMHRAGRGGEWSCQ